MFKWLTNLVDDARITYGYLGYERECKQQWIADAELTCSTAEVEQDIKARMADPMCHVSNAFDAPICDLESKCENVRSVVSDAKGKLFLLERDYKTELDAAYRSQDEACEQMKKCRQNLSEAYDDLKEAKDNLDSWYSRAEGNWFGNGGKQLPNHSFFGQDLSDRDSYKSDRDSAAHAIGLYKAERSSIEHRLDETRTTVNRIKEARQKMFDLKKAGFDKRIVTSTINTGNNDLCTLRKETTQFTKSRDEYIHQAKVSLGVYGQEKEIERLGQEKAARIKAFDSEPVVLERKAKHRAAWLAERGR